MKNLQTFLSISALSLASSMSIAAVDETKVSSATSNATNKTETVANRLDENSPSSELKQDQE